MKRFKLRHRMCSTLTLSFFILTVFSIECYECTNTPGFPGVKACDSDSVGKITCGAPYDRCMTTKYNMVVGPNSLAVVVKNCSASIGCGSQSDFNSKYKNTIPFN